MFGWIRELLEIRYEFRERRTRLKNEVRHEHKLCQSCETLKQQLEIANYEKQQILTKLLKEPTPEPTTPPVEITRPRALPWNIRRQLMEREDRERARLLRNAPKPISENNEKISTEELEKELGVAEQSREAQSK